MKNKINIAELLKDCPKGMELDCTMFENVTFEEVVTEIDCDGKEDISIIVLTHYNDGMVDEIILTEFGTYTYDETAKCVIFPKGKTTWKSFNRPFKDGDIIYVCDEYSDATLTYVAILKQIEKGGEIYSHCFYNFEDNYFSTHDFLYDSYNTRFATEEEKQKLFDAIKANGYCWNAETKILEKLPRFKVGDRIKLKEGDEFGIITQLTDCFYTIKNKNHTHYWSIKKQDDLELVPDKFDITTLKPFYKVLVKTDVHDPVWSIDFYGGYNIEKGGSFTPFAVTGGRYFQQCIPYKGNEHLCGTTNDCDDFYKTWQ